MSHPAITLVSRLPTESTVFEIYAAGSHLVILDNADEQSYLFTREEALLLVEAITARLAEVTEGQ